MATTSASSDQVHLLISTCFDGRWDPNDPVQREKMEKLIRWYQNQVPGVGVTKKWTNLTPLQLLEESLESGLLDQQFKTVVLGETSKS